MNFSKRGSIIKTDPPGRLAADNIRITKCSENIIYTEKEGSGAPKLLRIAKLTTGMAIQSPKRWILMIEGNIA